MVEKYEDTLERQASIEKRIDNIEEYLELVEQVLEKSCGEIEQLNKFLQAVLEQKKKSLADDMCGLGL